MTRKLDIKADFQILKASYTFVKVITGRDATYQQQFNQGLLESLDGDNVTIRWILPWQRLDATDAYVSQHHINTVEIA